MFKQKSKGSAEREDLSLLDGFFLSSEYDSSLDPTNRLYSTSDPASISLDDSNHDSTATVSSDDSIDFSPCNSLQHDRDLWSLTDDRYPNCFQVDLSRTSLLSTQDYFDVMPLEESSSHSLQGTKVLPPETLPHRKRAQLNQAEALIHLPIPRSFDGIRRIPRPGSLFGCADVIGEELSSDGCADLFGEELSSEVLGTVSPPPLSSRPNVKKGKKKRGPRRKAPDVKCYVEKTKLDVLMGRGGASNHHLGNEDYRKEILKHQEPYKNLSRQDKTTFSANIVRWVHGRGGRFLMRDGRGKPWYIAPDEVARQKVSQALREDHSPEGRAAKKSKIAKHKKIS